MKVSINFSDLILPQAKNFTNEWDELIFPSGHVLDTQSKQALAGVFK